MDNGTIPADTQPPANPVPVSPAVTGPGDPATPQPSTTDKVSDAVGDTTAKVRDNVTNLPVLSLVLAGLAAIGAFALMKGGRTPKHLSKRQA